MVLFVQDLGDVHTFTLIDASKTFTLGVLTNGSTVLRTMGAIDYEARSSYSLSITVMDSAGAVYNGIVDLMVRDVNEAPQDVYVALAGIVRSMLYIIDENQPPTTIVGTLFSNDPEKWQAHAFTLLRTTGGPPPFYIDQPSPSSPALLRTNESLNYESQSLYKVRVARVVSFHFVVVVVVVVVGWGGVG